jgi:hypothetical protein
MIGCLLSLKKRPKITTFKIETTGKHRNSPFPKISKKSNQNSS